MAAIGLFAFAVYSLPVTPDEPHLEQICLTTPHIAAGYLLLVATVVPAILGTIKIRLPFPSVKMHICPA